MTHWVAAPLRTEFAQVQVRNRTLLNTPVTALTKASQAADVVVPAAHRPRTRFGMRLGLVAHSVLHHAQYPVLLAPVAS